jgi:hypothetical protein
VACCHVAQCVARIAAWCMSVLAACSADCCTHAAHTVATSCSADRCMLHAPTRSSFAPGVCVCVCVCVCLCAYLSAGLAVGVDRAQRCGPVPHSAHAVTRPCARACAARESVRVRPQAGLPASLGAWEPARLACMPACVRVCVCACGCVRVYTCVRGQRRAAMSSTAARRCSASAHQRSRNASHPSSAASVRVHAACCILVLHVASFRCMLHPCLACCILVLHVASLSCMLHPCLACCIRPVHAACCILSLRVASFRCMLHPVSCRMFVARLLSPPCCMLAMRVALSDSCRALAPRRPSHGAFRMGFCGMSHGRGVTRS